MKSFTLSANNRIYLKPLVILVLVILVMAFALPGLASGGEVTRGDFYTFPDGIARGYDIGGHAQMVRTGSGKTLVGTHATGLAASTTYGVHVHNQACSNANGGGHYQNVLGGPVDPFNEIWPGFTTNPAGIGKGKAVHNFYARPEAQSVVIHDTDGKRIACADLE